MARTRWKHPLDCKTGRLDFTPVLRSTGKRLSLVLDFFTFPVSRAPGYRGAITDLNTGKRYAIYGKECDIPGCNCDAWVDEVASDAGEMRKTEGRLRLD